MVDVSKQCTDDPSMRKSKTLIPPVMKMVVPSDTTCSRIQAAPPSNPMVAPETFLSPVAQLGAPILGTMQWDNHTRQPGRMSYASVCKEKPVIRTSSHPLCLMVARQVDSQTVNVAPETFLAPVAQLGAPILGTMQWDNHTRQPGRTSYASVCQEKPVIRTSSHPLCLMVARQVDSQTVNVATFADERALQERMRLTYSNKMAMAPVAVFDIDLDDFNGTCGSGMSPLYEPWPQVAIDPLSSVIHGVPGASHGVDG
ncbi:hypothetical protein HPB51_027412 [Rhipicephalus microplus]|uniref:Uncharacterized protein n=1 Tax=Rhipicephalus microplus TaxID=6941 RepID=A0A9J6D0B5_RHIMP|nr:hypothetical protein HPB51_027412 [Rhipicephalus microplus]